MFQIDLSLEGQLLLHLPCGRAVEISASIDGLLFIKKIILDHRREIRNQPGYIGTFPTQHAVDKFLKEKARRNAIAQAEEMKGKASKLGVDLDRLEINL